MNKCLRIAGLIVTLLLASTTRAEVIKLKAFLDGAQEVPPVMTMASGFAVMSLDTVALTLDYSIHLTGLDIDGLQTPGDANDNVTGIHFHNAPAGANGGVFFGVLGPNHDLDDRVLDPVAGTITGAWEETDGAAFQSLSASIADLVAGNVYINVHTQAFPGGEIRGQVHVPEPGILALLGLGMFGLMMGRRRGNRRG